MRRFLISSLFITPMIVITQYAVAKNYNATNWLATTHILNEYPYQMWVKEVAEQTNGEINLKVHSSGSLLAAKSTMQGLKNGVAQVGIVYPPYTPSELPLTSVLTDVVFLSDDDMAAAFAWTEINLLNEKIQTEWSKNGGVFGGGYSTAVYNLICTKPVRNLTDTKGLKIRTAGGTQSDWVQEINAIPVSVPSEDIYTGLERGSIDCTLAETTNLSSGYRLWEVAKSINVLPHGVALGATYVYSPTFWKSVSSENRRVLLDSMALGLARSQVAYHVGVEEAYEGSRERGLEIIEPADDLKEKLAQFNESFLTKLPEKSMKDKGIDDPTAMIEEFIELENKWKMLLEDVDRTDVEAVYEVLYENLYKDIDEDSYGM